MVERLLDRLSAPIRGLHQAAYLLALLTLASQVLALVRDRLLASTFGAGPTLDLYYAGFRIPDFLFATLASLLSLYALMPVLSRLEEESSGKMMTFLRFMLGGFFVAMGLVALVGYIFAPYLLPLLAPGFTAPAMVKLVHFTRILLLQPIFLGGSNIIANLTQMRHRFVLYAVSPLLYNLGIITGIVVFYPLFGVSGLAWGVVFGAVLHFLLQLPYFVRERERAPISSAESWSHVREVLTLSIPRTLAVASTQISLLALTALASLLSGGSISVFTFAYNLQMVPISIIGVSYAVAAFPTLARLHVAGRFHELASHIENATRHLLFWSIPITVLTIVLRAQLVRVILGSGAFNWTATRLTAAALALFILSLAAQNLSLLISRAYYAAGNSKKPFWFGVADVVISIGGGILLLTIFEASPVLQTFFGSLLRVAGIPGTSVLMLALAYALGSSAEALIGYAYFVRDFAVEQSKIRRLTFQSLVASVVGGASAYGVLALFGASFTTLSVFVSGLTAGVVGLVVIALVLALFKNEELDEIFRALKARLGPPRIALEPNVEV